MLEFKPISLEDKATVDKYMYRFGEGSCQHSFVSMYCMYVKYGDEICEKDGYLFVFRRFRSTSDKRIYMCPMGPRDDKAAFKAAVEEVLNDAAAHNCIACFNTVTASVRLLIEEAFPGRFVCETSRNYFEYIYTFDKLAYLPGHEMASKRYDLSCFEREYGNRVKIVNIDESNIPDIRMFQARWLEYKMKNSFDVQLEAENSAIDRGLSFFNRLGLKGIAVYIDNEINGYAYGSALNNDYFDVLIEKGANTVTDIYKVLNRDLVRIHCSGFSYINREEDVGVKGLRTAKMSYKPDMFIEKYILTEGNVRE